MELQRTKCVTILWTHTRTASSTNGIDPTDYGWNMNGSTLEPIWFVGPAIPDNLFEQEDTQADIEPEPEELSDDDAWSDDSDSDDDNNEY